MGAMFFNNEMVYNKISYLYSFVSRTDWFQQSRETCGPVTPRSSSTGPPVEAVGDQDLERSPVVPTSTSYCGRPWARGPPNSATLSTGDLSAHVDGPLRRRRACVRGSGHDRHVGSSTSS